MLLWPLNSKNKISSAGTFSCPTQYFINEYNSLLSFHFLCLSCQFNLNNATQSNSLLLSSAFILMSSVSLIYFVSSLVSVSSVSHVFCAIGINASQHTPPNTTWRIFPLWALTYSELCKSLWTLFLCFSFWNAFVCCSNVCIYTSEHGSGGWEMWGGELWSSASEENPSEKNFKNTLDISSKLAFFYF